MSVPPLVEVMRGESVALNCTPLGVHDYFMLEWYLVSALGWGPEGLEGGTEVREQWGCKHPFSRQSPKDPKSTTGLLPFHFTDGEFEAQQREGTLQGPLASGHSRD